MTSQPQISDNADLHRYEAHVDDSIAGFVNYHPARDLTVLTHTEVDPSFEGRGIGGALAEAALEDLRSRGIKALVICPFIIAWLRKHPEYADVLYQAPPSKVTD